MDMDGRRVVVLGGTGGFGFAAAKAAVEAGAEVVIGARTAQKVSAAARALGARTWGMQVDVADEESLTAFFEAVGALDHLVTAVGDALPRLDFRSTPVALAKPAFEVRFWGQYNAARLAAPRLAKDGSITLTSGTSSQRGMAGFVLGGGVCGAVEGLTRQLCVELAPLRVNCVVAGIVETDLWSRIPEGQRAAFFEARGRALPVGRIGRPEDVGQAYLYLIRNGFSTGASLVVDGGALVSGA